MMRTVGIDAALAATGWAVLDGERLHDWGVIETEPGDGSGTALFERIRVLHDALAEVLYMNSQARQSLPLVGIEWTDWQHGRLDDRSALVREAKARGALGTGFAVACCTCMEFNIQPHILGAREWMRLFGSTNKDDTAKLVAAMFSRHFTADWEPARRSLRRDDSRLVVRDVQGHVVPSHVTDALAIAHVAQCQAELGAKIAEVEPNVSYQVLDERKSFSEADWQKLLRHAKEQ